MNNTTLKPWSQHFKKIFFSQWPRLLAALGLLLLSSGNLFAQPTVATLGGGAISPPYYGYKEGNTTSVAKFNMPAGMALDPSGAFLFVADYNNSAIRLVSTPGNPATSVTSTFANATNNGGIADINHPLAVVVDSATNVFVLNYGNGINGAVLHLSGIYINSGLVLVYSPLTTGLVNATAMAMDGYNNLYVTVNGNKVIRVTPGGVVSTIGTVNQAGTSLQGIAVMDNGQLALSDAANNGIWMMNPVTGTSTKFTGFHGGGDTNGPAQFASFNTPENISKAGGGVLVVADRGNNKVKLVDQSGSVSLLYGVSSNLWVKVPGSYPGWWDGPGLPTQGSAESRQPYGVLVGPDGSVYASEVYYHVLRHVTGAGLTGPQPGYPQFFNAPSGIALDSGGTSLYIADFTNNAVQLLKPFATTNQTTTFLKSTDGVSHPASVLVDPSDNVYVLNQNAGTNGSILKFDNNGNAFGTILTGLNQPTALTMDGNGNIFITERAGSIKVLFSNGASNTIVTISTNLVTLKTNVQLQGIAIFDDGYLAVSDAGNHVIWTVNPITKIIAKLTGQLGTNGTSVGASNFAKLYQPHQLARAGGNQIVAADYGNNRLVMVQRNGTISTNAFNSSSQLWFGKPNDPANGNTMPMRLPAGVAVSVSGLVYDSEPTNQAIRSLNAPVAPPPAAPIVTLPFFNGPQGIAFDSIANALFIADYANNAVQMLDLTANLTTTFLAMGDGILNPVSVLVDTNENIFVLNQGTPGNGSILEFDYYGNAYGPIATGLNQPTAFTMDGYGNLFVTEQSGNIRAFGASLSNIVATVTNANVSLQGIALFDDGNIAVSDAGNHVIWTINPITKLITKLTGQLGTNGTAVGASNFAKLNQPHQLARVGGNQIVAADYGNNRLVLVQRNGTVITNNTTIHLNSSVASIWFGQNGDPIASGSPKFVPMVRPAGVALGVGGEIFASETYYEDIRGLTGTGLTAPSFNPGVPLPVYASLGGIALNNASTLLFIADPTNNTISKLDLGNNQTTAFLDASSGIYQPVDVGVDSSDNVYVLNQGTGGNGSVMEFDQYGNLLRINASSLPMPTAIKVTFTGDIYVSELNGLVQKFSAGISNTVANITTNANVRLSGIALLDDKSVVVSDVGNHVLWKIAQSATNAVLFTGVIGSPGTTFGAVGFAKLNKPMRLAQANDGLLLIVDSGNNRVVVADDLGTISKPLNSTNATLWFGHLPPDPVSTNSPNYVSMVSPVGVAIGTIGTNGIVFASENYYKDIRGILNTGIHAPIPPPPTPLNLVAVATYGQVSLTWTPSSGATNYYVKRSTSTNIATFNRIGSTSITSYTDTNLISGTTYYYVVSALNGGGESPDSLEASATPLIPPPPAPRIGWYDYEGNTQTGFYTVLHPISLVTFNNDQLIAIDPGTNGVSTYYISTNGPQPVLTNPSSTNGSTPPFYQDGVQFVQPLNVTTVPDLVIKAVNVGAGGSSPVTTAEFIFQVANPTISGNNAAQFSISDITSNSVFWYTIDGSDPTNASPSIGPILSNTNGSPVLLTLNGSTNVLFKVRAFRSGYQPSGIAVQSFSPGNFLANAIRFGAASGEPSSKFLTRPGQFYYAPVVLQLLPGFGKMYSLQFNVTVTNGLMNTNTIQNGTGINFFSMLMTSVPPSEGQYFPPADGSWYLGIPAVTDNNVTNIFVNTNNNLLGVGWFYRTGFKYKLVDIIGNVLLDFDTAKQDLITYSIAHDTLFTKASGTVLVGAYSFQVPTNANYGDTYFIQIGSPSATADGVGAPGADIYIAPPATNQAVTVGAPVYLVGDAAPFHWFNAGDFGNALLDNSDVMQVYQSAIEGVNMPPANSDLYAGMDSCGNFGISNAATGYFTNGGSFLALFPVTNMMNFNSLLIITNDLALGSLGSMAQNSFTVTNITITATTNFIVLTTNIVYTISSNGIPIPPSTMTYVVANNVTFYNNNLTALFNGSDQTINQIAFGDGNLDVCDLYVTFRRSLDPSLVWFERYWTNNQFVAVTTTNLAFNTNIPHLMVSKAVPSVTAKTAGSPDYRQSIINFSAGDAVVTANQTIQIPINAQIFGGYPLRVLGLNLTVVPLDGSPAITQQVTFTPVAGLGLPQIASSKQPANYSAAWLNSTISGLTGTALIGTLTVIIPASASSQSSYAVHFDQASGSPNGLAVFPKQTLTGLITLSSRTNSTYGDGIPNAWRLRWFGTVNNLLSASNACPTGDGISNWKKFVAGVDPNTANDFPSVNAKTPVPTGATTAIHWPTVSGKQYVIERSTSLFPANWTAITTNTGTGGDVEFDDTNPGKLKFYRVRILP